MNRTVHIQTSAMGRVALVAVAAVVLILVLPVALLVGLALVVMGGIKVAFTRLRRLVRGDGRANVRVIR